MKWLSASGLVLALASSTPAWALEIGEEVDISAASITALPCALLAKESGDLTVLGSCPTFEVARGIVAFDVAEQQIYRIAPKRVHRYQLEKAFGGGSMDFVGKVVAIDPATGIATVEVEEFSITPKPKPGAFKGCL